METYSTSLKELKIKDFELSEVFKLQLKAMQDAVIERDEALLTVKKQKKKLPNQNWDRL